MEMQFKNEIKKLADIVVWADNGIEEMRMDLSSLTEEKFKNLDAVKDLETVKKVVLESMERQTVYSNALNKDIADKAAKIELLEKEIEGRKAGYLVLKERMEHMTASKECWHANAQELVETCKSKNKEIEKLKVDLIHEREKNEKLARAHAELENDMRKSYTDIISQSKTICNLKKELEETYRTKEADLKNHNKRDMTLVDELAKKNDEIKKLEESIDYYKNQERIRTDQLRATESKVDELWGLVNELKKEKKEGDDYAREGFKIYVKNALIEAEGDKNEANEVITEAVRSAYAEWSKVQKEEETEVKGVGRTNSGRYPWGAKVNDIPCGEDSIE